MRMFKLALIAMAALLLGSVSASAITVKKRIEGPGLPPEIWKIVGDFCAIKTWHPAVTDCVETKEGDVTYRTLTLKDGGVMLEYASVNVFGGQVLAAGTFQDFENAHARVSDLESRLAKVLGFHPALLAPRHGANLTGP